MASSSLSVVRSLCFAGGNPEAIEPRRHAEHEEDPKPRRIREDGFAFFQNRSGVLGRIELETVTLKVNGMTCQGCVSSVTKALQAVTGVASAEVSLERAEAKVSYSPREVSVERLKVAIDDAGYEAGAG